jgi:hypothetical protein
MVSSSLMQRSKLARFTSALDQERFGHSGSCPLLPPKSTGIATSRADAKCHLRDLALRNQKARAAGAINMCPNLAPRANYWQKSVSTCAQGRVVHPAHQVEFA